MTLILGFFPAVGADSGHWYDESEKNVPGFQSGVLTANLGEVLEIDGKRYRMHRDAKVTDDHGNEQDPGIMRAGDELKFDLEKGWIKQVIWIMPR